MDPIYKFEKSKSLEILESLKQINNFSTFANIYVEQVAKYFDLDKEKLFNASIAKERLGRNICAYLLVNKSEELFNKKNHSWIGGIFGMNHTTVIHSYNKIFDEKTSKDGQGKKIREILTLCEML